MVIRSISIFFLGVTLLYAGVLSLADDLYVGIGMMFGGSILVVLPLWRVLAYSRSLSSGPTGRSVKTKEEKTHLKIVKPDDEDRPTYH
jgi:hypothetical protein